MGNKYGPLGKGYNAQADFDQAVKVFQQTIGRPPSASEASWLQTRGDIGKVSYTDAVQKVLIPKLQTYAANIQQEASAVGLNLSPEEANKIRDQYYVVGQEDRFAPLYRAELTKRLNTQAEAKTEKAISDVRNPTISAEQEAEAAELVSGILGRNATKQEISYFAGELAQGVKPYEIQGQLQQTPEYQDKIAEQKNQKFTQEAEAARNALNTQLLESQKQAFERALPTIMSSYMRAGRIGSSGLDNAIAQAQKELDQQRQSYLGNLAYQDAVRGQGYTQQAFVNNNANAFNQYLRQTDPYQQGRMAASQAQSALQYQYPFQAAGGYASGLGGFTQREQSLADYDRQQSDYNRYYNQARDDQSNAARYQLFGNVIGAGLGGFGYFAANRNKAGF